MTNKCVHAELMLQYANDAMTSDRPWELWQASDIKGDWFDMETHPKWAKHTDYRRKPQTVTYERSVSFVEDDNHCPVHMNKLPSGNNVKFIFDKSSKELIGVELIKE